MRGALITLTILSVICFPWPFSVALVLAAALFEPLLPLAAGLLSDTLYFSLGQGIPLASVAGGLITIFAYLARTRLDTRRLDQ